MAAVWAQDDPGLPTIVRPASVAYSGPEGRLRVFYTNVSDLHLRIEAFEGEEHVRWEVWMTEHAPYEPPARPVRTGWAQTFEGALHAARRFAVDVLEDWEQEPYEIAFFQ